MRQMFKHEDFQFGYEIALGSAYPCYADVGEVLTTGLHALPARGSVQEGHLRQGDGLDQAAIRDTRLFDWLDRYLAA